MAVQAYYLSGDSVILSDCDTIGTVMVRIAMLHNRFASEIVAVDRDSGVELMDITEPAPRELFVVLLQTPSGRGQEVNIQLHASQGDQHTVNKAVELFREEDALAPEHMLAKAALAGEEILACALLRAGVDGSFALMSASLKGYLHVVEGLLSQGVSINSIRPYSVTILTLMYVPAHIWGNFAGTTALMWAAMKGHKEVVARLLAAGAAVDHVNSNGWSAMALAACEGHKDVVDILVAAGASR